MSQLEWIKKRQASDGESIPAAAHPNSELIRVHDKATKIGRIKAQQLTFIHSSEIV